MKHSKVLNAFNQWKIWLAILIGLSLAFLALNHAMNQKQFVLADANNGTHKWIDNNKNGKVDFQNDNEFVKASKGKYRLQSGIDAIKATNWNTSSWLWVIIALIFMFGRDYFYMGRIRHLNHKEISWKSSFYIIMLWEFASAVSPGIVGGSTVAMFILNRENIPLGKSTAIVMMTLFMDNLFYVLAIPILFIFVDYNNLFELSSIDSKSVQWIFWIGYGLILSVCTFLFCCLFIFPNLASKFILMIFKLPLLRRWKLKGLQMGRDLSTTSFVFKEAKFSFWFKTFLWTCGSWISRYLVINALVQAFLRIDLWEHLLLLGKQFILWMFLTISPTPGGSGVAEFAFGELLVNFSTSAILLAGIAVIWRLISYFPYLFIGAFLFPRWLRKKQ